MIIIDRSKVITEIEKIIYNLDEGEGAERDEIILIVKRNNLELNHDFIVEFLADMVEHGVLYQPSPIKYKLM